jgi:hypothetical protein
MLSISASMSSSPRQDLSASDGNFLSAKISHGGRGGCETPRSDRGHTYRAMFSSRTNMLPQALSIISGVI